MITKVDNHVERALSRLSQQFQNKPLIENLVTALVKPMQRWEDANHDLCNQLDPDQAIGVHLDLIGTTVGQPREGRVDVDYSRVIKAKIAANNSEGTLEELISIIRLLLNNLTIPVTTIWHQPKALEFLVGDDVVDFNKLVDIIRLLLVARDPGTNIYLKFLTAPLAETFQFDTGPGFDSGAQFACVTTTHLTAKTTSYRPTSSTVWAASYGTVAEPIRASSFQDGGQPLTDHFGANPFTTEIGTGIDYNSTGPEGGLAVELGPSNGISVGSTTHQDAPLGTDLGFLFDCWIPAAAGTVYTVVKATSGIGYSVRTQSGGTLQLWFNPSSGGNVLITIPGDHRNQWFRGVVAIDRTNALLRFHTSLGVGTEVAIPAFHASSGTALTHGFASGLGAASGVKLRYEAGFDFAPTTAQMAALITGPT